MAVRQLDRLDPRHTGKVEGVGNADTHLVAGAVGRLVPEQHEVVAAPGGPLGLDRLDDRGRRRHGIPLAAIGFQQHRPLDAERHRITQLVSRGLRP